MISLNNINKVHFVGIGGISMSGLAETLRFQGFNVSGSDSKESDITKRLKEKGINVYIGQKYENVDKDCELIVYTAAVKSDNPEIAAANDLGIKTVDRAALLGAIMAMYEYPVGVSGTHGKTTTTSMISEMMLLAGLDPTLNIGGIFTTIGSNFRTGGSEYFVAESCEYFDSFSKLYPYAGLILNIEHDHADYFKTMEQLENSFHKFAGNIKENGALIINSKIACLDKITAGLKCKVITFGEGGDFYPLNVKLLSNGTASFDLMKGGDLLTHIKLNTGGMHNVSNAVAACACCDFLGISPEIMSKAMGQFNGAKRRFEHKGEFNGVKVVDDYAHHPTEIEVTLAAAKEYESKRIIAVFQPHTFTRTKAFLEDFAKAFKDADMVIVLDIYSARELSDDTIHSKDLVNKMNERGTDAHYLPSFKEAENFILKNCGAGDLLITLGAGDVHIVGENVLLTALSTLSTEN